MPFLTHGVGLSNFVKMFADESLSTDRTNGLVFRVRGLTKTYGSSETEVHALAGVDLDFYEGELVVLLGPSGSGKPA